MVNTNSYAIMLVRKKHLIFQFFLIFFFSGCGELRNVFQKESPYEKYTRSLKESGLMETALGKAWVDAGDAALKLPLAIKLPYKEEGYFFADEAKGRGYSFTASRGEIVEITVGQSDDSFDLFIDLFEINEKETERVASADLQQLEFEVGKNGNFILRIQPELLKGGGYSLTIQSKPSLMFPVSGQNSNAIQSFWGAARGGGSRSHEGVDIFAPRGTPVIAVTDGYVVRTGNNNLGGKVVWLRHEGKSIYYAHLDSQWVEAGTKVKKGDTLGTVGNTGNAKYTNPHLHFGIYVSGGAVDPLPYIKDVRPKFPVITADQKLLTQWGRMISDATIGSGNEKINLRKNTPLRIVAAARDQYLSELPDARVAYIPARMVTGVGKPLQDIKIESGSVIVAAPSSGSDVIHIAVQDTTMELWGYYESYKMVKYREHFVWVSGI